MCPSFTSGMKDPGMKKNNRGLFDGWSALKMTKDEVNDILFTPISKTLIQLDVLKQQSSNITEMTSGRYVSI